jgi:SAM-dependent methyltransferase
VPLRDVGYLRGVSDGEFDVQASAIAVELLDLPSEAQIAAACRGSGNPAALAWLGVHLRVNPGTSFVDIGAGLGGPAAWLVARYHCRVIALDPAAGAACAAASLFMLPVMLARADSLPVRSDAFDVALLLGVVSVVSDAVDVLGEAHRVGRRLGLLDYCATRRGQVEAGGSRFVSSEALTGLVTRAGWVVDRIDAVPVPAPQSWLDAADSVDVEVEPSEAEVIAAIAEGAIAPFMLVAER